MPRTVREPATVAGILAVLEPLSSAANRAGMARYGIKTENAFGVPLSELRPMARRIISDHQLAADLWDTGIRECRLLASFVDEPEWVTPAQMDAWAAAFESWDVVDGVCDLFSRSAHARGKIAEWTQAGPEFVRRAGFVLIARRAVAEKAAADDEFLGYLLLIERGSTDQRNYVRKAVNWALRQIGKRSKGLYGPALDLADKLAASDDRTARWIGRDAARELRSEPIRRRLGIAPPCGGPQADARPKTAVAP